MHFFSCNSNTNRNHTYTEMCRFNTLSSLIQKKKNQRNQRNQKCKRTSAYGSHHAAKQRGEDLLSKCNSSD